VDLSCFNVHAPTCPRVTIICLPVNNTNDERKLQGDIDRLIQWSKDWLLTFNKSKCKHVLFGPPNNIHLLTGYEGNNTFIVPKVPTNFQGNAEENSWYRGDN
jgi:hypothetical protein